MKDVKAIREKREELKKELARYKNRKNELYGEGIYKIEFRKMNDGEKRIWGTIMSIVKDLQTQIDVLTYVMNEDSDMNDVTYLSYISKVSREDIFGENEKHNICCCAPCLNKRN